MGISVWMNEVPGWDCIIKHRYADFIVQEVDKAGNVIGANTVFAGGTISLLVLLRARPSVLGA